ACTVELVGDPVDRDRLDRGIAEDHLLDTVRGRVTLEGGEYIFREEGAECRDPSHEAERDLLRPVGVPRRAGGAEPLVAGRPPYRLDQALVGRVDARGQSEVHLRLVARARRV